MGNGGFLAVMALIQKLISILPSKIVDYFQTVESGNLGVIIAVARVSAPLLSSSINSNIDSRVWLHIRLLRL